MSSRRRTPRINKRRDPKRPERRIRLIEDHAGDLCAGLRVLVSVTDAVIEDIVAEHAAETVIWRRYAWRNRPATPWPPEGTCDAALLQMPREKRAFEMQLHAATARLAPGGTLWVFGANDEGIRSAPRLMKNLYEDIDTVAIKARHRLLSARERVETIGLRPDIEDWRETIGLAVPLGPEDVRKMKFVSYPGVFAEGRLDAGTELLLQNLPGDAIRSHVLDFGCGIGVIAAALQERQRGIRTVLLDVDSVALHAAGQNLPGATCAAGDGWGALEEARIRERFDLIATNPPFHSQRDEDFALMRNLIAGAPSHLLPRGRLVLVTQRTIGVGRLFDQAFPGRARLLAEDRRYQVWTGAMPG